jgi:hypothetical protein
MIKITPIYFLYLGHVQSESVWSHEPKYHTSVHNTVINKHGNFVPFVKTADTKEFVSYLVV